MTILRHQKAWTVVFNVSELAQAIFRFADTTTLHTLRLVCRSFLFHCDLFFEITLDIDNESHHQDLDTLYDRSIATAVKGTTARFLNPLDRIKGVKVQLGHASFAKPFTPVQYKLPILSRCRNLRHVTIKDPTAQSSRVRALEFYRQRFTTEKGYSHRVLWCPFTAGKDAQCDTEDRTWSHWDQLPLESNLLCRLESLTMEAGCLTATNMGGFLRRLSRSCVNKTLKSFMIAGFPSANGSSTVTWEVLRECITSLRVLEKLELRRVSIVIKTTSIGNSYNKNNSTGTANCRSQELQRQWEAPTVRILSFDCDATAVVKVAIMRLFPNLESLQLSPSSSDFLTGEVDHLIFSSYTRDDASNINNSTIDSFQRQQQPSSSSGGGLPLANVPCPRLKSLGCRLTGIEDWTRSKLLQAWVQRRPHFQINNTGLVLVITPRDLPPGPVEELISILSRYHARVLDVSVHQFYHKKSIDEVCPILTSTCFHALEELYIERPENIIATFPRQSSTTNSTMAVIAKKVASHFTFIAGAVYFGKADPRALFPLDPSPLLPSPKQVFLTMPWVMTLTKLSLTPVDAKFEQRCGKGSTIFIRALLRMMPRLVDLTISGILRDLSLFDGLGRSPLSSFVTKPARNTDADTSRSSSSSWSQLENYCLTELPLLKRLNITQEYEQPEEYEHPEESWHQVLSLRFRFLERLSINQLRSVEPSDYWDAYI